MTTPIDRAERVKALIQVSDRGVKLLDLHDQRALIAEIRALQREVKELRQVNEADNVALKEALRERDLAIAHDRQLYPTVEAYELVCKTLNSLKERHSKLLEVVKECSLPLPLDRMPKMTIQQALEIFAERAMRAAHALVADSAEGE